MWDFQNKIAVVTGGTSGIGRSVAVELARGGARVAIIGRNEQAARELTGEWGMRFYSCDLRSVEETIRTFEKIEADFEQIDILVNCSGVGDHTPIDQITEESWNYVYDLNLRGMFFCSQQGARLMKKGGRGGRIVSLSSLFAESADGRHALYSGTKAAIRAVSRNLAAEYAKDGICCNTVSPSFVRTPMTEHNFENGAWIAAVEKKTPAGRLLQLREVTEAILFLCSDAASGITGENVNVDLGLNVRR